MSSDDDEELAQLRAQRAARLGPGETATLVGSGAGTGTAWLEAALHARHDIPQTHLLLPQSQLREKQRLAQSSRSAADVFADR